MSGQIMRTDAIEYCSQTTEKQLVKVSVNIACIIM